VAYFLAQLGVAPLSADLGFYSQKERFFTRMVGVYSEYRLREK
jgi:hypothetical protein